MTDPIIIILIAIGIFSLIIYVVSIIVKKKHQKIMGDIETKIKNAIPDGDIKIFSRKELFQFQIADSKKEVLVKLIYSKPEYEFIITNSNRWTVNSNPMQWSRKTKPIFIEDANEFINYDSSQNLKKIVLIYPSSKRIIRYLNESDTVIVKPEEKHNSIHFVSYNDFEKILMD